MTDYTTGAGGRYSMHPADSALTSLPRCGEVHDGVVCDALLWRVAGTVTRVRCTAGHERPADSESDRRKVAEIDGAMRAFERRGGSIVVSLEELLEDA